MLFISHAICAAQFAFHNLGAKLLQIFGIYKDFMEKIKFICNFFNYVSFFWEFSLLSAPFRSPRPWYNRHGEDDKGRGDNGWHFLPSNYDAKVLHFFLLIFFLKKSFFNENRHFLKILLSDRLKSRNAKGHFFIPQKADFFCKLVTSLITCILREFSTLLTFSELGLISSTQFAYVKKLL